MCFQTGRSSRDLELKGFRPRRCRLSSWKSLKKNVAPCRTAAAFIYHWVFLAREMGADECERGDNTRHTNCHRPSSPLINTQAGGRHHLTVLAVLVPGPQERKGTCNYMPPLRIKGGKRGWSGARRKKMAPPRLGDGDQENGMRSRPG